MSIVYRWSPAAFVAVAFAVGPVESVPALEPWIIPAWGEAFGGGSEIVARDGVLTFGVPGGYRDLVATDTLKNFDAPKVVQRAEGDFTIQVRARKFNLPQPKSAGSTENPNSYVAGGLLMMKDEKTFLRLQLAANGDSQGGPRPFIHANQFADGKMVANVIIRDVGPEAVLRIERRGDNLFLDYNTDGRNWNAVQMQGMPRGIAGDVRIGVFVINATNRKITHEFSDFKLEQ